MSKNFNCSKVKSFSNVNEKKKNREIQKNISNNMAQRVAIECSDMLENLFRQIIFYSGYKKARAWEMNSTYKPKMIDWKFILSSARIAKKIPHRFLINS